MHSKTWLKISNVRMLHPWAWRSLLPKRSWNTYLNSFQDKHCRKKVFMRTDKPLLPIERKRLPSIVGKSLGFTQSSVLMFFDCKQLFTLSDERKKYDIGVRSKLTARHIKCAPLSCYMEDGTEKWQLFLPERCERNVQQAVQTCNRTSRFIPIYHAAPKECFEHQLQVPASFEEY